MNYAKMIEILEWVKANRKDGRGVSTEGIGSSAYVCDNISRYQSGGDLSTYAAKDAIKADIKVIIGRKFGVAEHLGYDDDSSNDYGNERPDVIAFRSKMLDDLIARYTEAQNAAV